MPLSKSMKIIQPQSETGLGKAELKKIVRMLDTLPTLPQIAAKVLRLFTEGEPDMDEIINLIKADQALTMKILKLVNSAYYSLSNRISSIQKAVVMLGFDEVRSILLSVTVSESVINSLSKSGTREQTEIWKHALASAICAEMIAGQVCPALKGELFIGGLLHDIGRLVLRECFSEQMDLVQQQNTFEGTPLIEAESDIIGVDHTTVGKWLAEKWNLPEVFTQAIWLHHHPVSSCVQFDFVKQKDNILIVRLADIIAHRIMADSLTFHYGSEDFNELLEYLRIKPKFTEHLAASLGKYYDEWASLLGLQEGEVSFYYQSLQRANQKLGQLVSEMGRHHSVHKSNYELSLLHDLHLGLAQLDDVEQILTAVAEAVSSKLKKPEGVIYYHNRPGKCLIGSSWSTEYQVEPFLVPLNDREQPREPIPFKGDDPARRLIATRHERIQNTRMRSHEVMVLQYSRPYLVIPLLDKGTCIGEVALAENSTEEKEPLTRERLSTLTYLASIAETALAHTSLVEEVKSTAESLSTALAKNHQTLLLLKKSREEFEHLFEYSNDAIILHLTDGTVVRVNQRAVELLGYSKEELKTSTALRRLLDEGMHAACAEAREHHNDEKGILFTTQIRHQDGTAIDVEVSSRLSDPGSGLMQSLLRDVTRQKQIAHALWAEKERLTVTLRSIGDGVITTDTQGKIILINTVAEHLTGWSQDAALGRSLQEIFQVRNEKTHEPIENPVERVLRLSKTVELPPYTTLTGKDGIERLIADTAAPIVDRDGTIIGVVLVFRDITEKQKLEQEILKGQKFESLTILASGIAHDFNNILTAITGSITLAKMYAKPGEKTFEKLTQAEKASQRAKDLTRQLSTFSKGCVSERKIASITELIKDSVSFILRGSNVRCDCIIADDVRPAEVDAGQINQVLNNLLINADQAMENGGIITVSAENYNVGAEDTLPLEPGHYIKIAVKDQGIGIPKSDLPKIFDPYFTTKREGNGLGLATAYSIMRRHNGYITVESEPGVGTTFLLYLPAAKDKTAIPKADDEHPIAGKGKILLMDDEEEIRHLTGEMLESLGYKVSFAKDGVEAVEYYRNARAASAPFDAVIIDLTIPGSMGGKETIQELHKIDPNVKAIICSGYTADPVLAECEKYGFKDFITKPYQITVLSRILHTLTGNGHGKA